MMLAAQDQTAEARENLSPVALERAEADADIAYWTAAAYALLGERDAAFKWLEHSVKLGFEDRRWIENDKTLANLHTDERFGKLMMRISST